MYCCTIIRLVFSLWHILAYPGFGDPDLRKIETKNDEIKELKHKTKKHDYEVILKSLKIEKEYFIKI